MKLLGHLFKWFILMQNLPMTYFLGEFYSHAYANARQT